MPMICSFVEMQKLIEIFSTFKVKCIVPNCSYFYHDIDIKEWLQCFGVTLKCPIGHHCSWFSSTMIYKDNRSRMPISKLQEFCAPIGLKYVQISTWCKSQEVELGGWMLFYKFGNKRKQLWWKNWLRQMIAQWFVLMLISFLLICLSWYTSILDAPTKMILETVTKTQVESKNSLKIDEVAFEEGLKN